MKYIVYLFILFLIAAQNALPQNYGKNINQNSYIFHTIPENSSRIPSNSVKSGIETMNGFDNFRLGTDFAESMIATNPNDPLNSICTFARTRLYYTLDGFNWINVNNVSGPNPDNFVCYDSLGNAYFTVGIGYTLYILKSTNKGINWATYSIYTGSFDKMSIIADQTGGPFGNYVYSTWQFPILVSRSTNGGISWSTPVTVNNSSQCYCSWLAIGPNGSIQGGNLYCGYNIFYTNNDSVGVLVNRSTDGGITFLNAVFAVKYLHPGNLCGNYYLAKICKVQTNEEIQMAADNSYGPNRGNLYIVYGAHGNNTDIADIFFIRSTNYGVNWSPPYRVNDDNTNTDQWMPSIAVDKVTGKIYLSWYDSRIDPVNNLQTKLYAAMSTDGGLTFSANTPVSTVSFNPVNIVQNFGWNGYMGHYNGISAIGNTAYFAWVDGRNNNMGSYTGFYPDFAMEISPVFKNLVNNDSTIITIKIPGVNGAYNSRINFSCALDSLPVSGNINLTFVNGKDYITTIPDSVKLRVLTSANVTPGVYKLNIIGRSQSGVPVHKRIVNLLVNYSHIFVGTNRNDTVIFKVNGTPYTRRQEFYFPNNTNVTIQALSPFTMAYKNFIYTHWSDNGDTTHTILLNNSNLDLVAYYRLQCKLTVISSQGNTFGGNVFLDSGASATIGVNSRTVINGGTVYIFKGWNGIGNGSYTSPDSTGLDSIITINNIINPITETVRWMPVTGIVNISSDIPKEYKLYPNYPNPFNAMTKIKFDIPKTEFRSQNSVVKLIIYDILGREVKTLVNEKLQPGVYEVTFDGSSLSSGIYFYQLKISNAYLMTKKMVIFK